MNDQIKKWQLWLVLAVCIFIQYAALAVDYRPVYGECDTTDLYIGEYMHGCAPSSWELDTLVGSIEFKDGFSPVEQNLVRVIWIIAIVPPLFVEIATLKILIWGRGSRR